MKKHVSLIIPFYNEGTRVFHVLDTVTPLSSIDEIFVIDDSENDQTTHKLIKEKYPRVTVIKLPTNVGKSGAVREGVKYTTGEYVLLLDADLTGVKAEEVENAIKAITSNETIAMVILRRVNDDFFPKLFHADVIVSGERIIKKTILEKVLELKPVGFQLEVAINQYMIKHNLQVYTVPNSAHNYHKFSKYGFLAGFINEVKMDISMVKYVGFLNLCRQITVYGRKEFSFAKDSD